MNILIRPMQLEDCPTMANFHSRAVRQAFAGHYSPEAVEYWASTRKPERYINKSTNHNETFLVACLDTQPIGFISWNNGELSAMYVDPDHHGKGIGSKLLNAADALASPALTFVKAAIPARGFYEKHGFRFVRENTSQLGDFAIPDIYMERT